MSKEIYNEGRVVGYSAYEMYVKEHKEIDPDSEVASEREWLASSLFMGSSMILKLANINVSGSTPTVVEYALPTYTTNGVSVRSGLCACNTIIGSFFDGECAFNDNSHIWASKVTSYGTLINNTASSSPSGHVTTINSTTVPRGNGSMTASSIARMKDYTHILDAVIIQPGTWTNSSSGSPKKDFSPDMNRQPTIRITVTKSITETYILLSGFTSRTVASGECGVDSSVDTRSPQDGDFLGPQCFPWANKVIFTMPTSYIQTCLDMQLISIDNNNQEPWFIKHIVGDNTKYTLSMANSNGVVYNVRPTSGSFVDIPVTSTTSGYATNYSAEFTFGTLIDMLYKQRRGRLQFTVNGTTGSSVSVNNSVPYVKTTIGANTGYALAMANSSGTLYPTSGSSGYVNVTLSPDYSTQESTIYSGSFSWDDLLSMLKNNRKCKLSFTVAKIPQENKVVLDVTNLMGKDQNGVSQTLICKLMFGQHVEYKKFMPYDRSMGLPEYVYPSSVSSQYDGYWRAILTCYQSIGQIGKCSIRFAFYLKSNTSVSNPNPGTSNFAAAGAIMRCNSNWYNSNYSAQPMFYGKPLSTDLGERSLSILKSDIISQYQTVYSGFYSQWSSLANKTLEFNSGGPRWQPAFKIYTTSVNRQAGPELEMIACDNSYCYGFNSDQVTSYDNYDGQQTSLSQNTSLCMIGGQYSTESSHTWYSTANLESSPSFFADYLGTYTI